MDSSRQDPFPGEMGSAVAIVVELCAVSTTPPDFDLLSSLQGLEDVERDGCLVDTAHAVLRIFVGRSLPLAIHKKLDAAPWVT